MKHDRLRHARRDLAQPVEIEVRLALELVRAVRGADRHRQRIDLGLGGEPDGLIRIGQHRPHRLLAEILDAAERAELGFHVHAASMRVRHDVARLAHVLLERLARGVDHHGGVARVDRGARQLLALAVIEVQRHGRLRPAGQLRARSRPGSRGRRA